MPDIDNVPTEIFLSVVAERDFYRRSLEEIANRPVVELNPDGVDQAAWSMQLIAQETVAAYEPSAKSRRDPQ